MKIAFCITCKNRAQHVKVTLPVNLAAHANDDNAVFVLVDYGSEDDLIPYLESHHAADIASGRLVLYRYATQARFHMAHAKNLAHRLGIVEGADVLVNLDADNFTGTDFATFLRERFAEPDVFYATGAIQRGITPRGLSGRIACTAQAFVKAGGYDERFNTWSPDDKDFNFRLRRLGYTFRQIPGQFLDCVRHNDKMRFREYPEVSTGAYSDHLDLVQGTATIANFGRFGLGVVTKNFSDEALELSPVATRIFGIGMHKTGTTSLYRAFKELKLDAAHWENAHWAKAIWTEMKTGGRSSVLERHYALCDLPFTLLYKELDRAYPGSKFILTLRNEATWLDSIEKHWSFTHNPYRAQWDTDPFTHRVHLELYGRKKFDTGVMLARYRRHEAEVRAYFAGREQDLLVMDMDRWPSLCRFIGTPRIPAVSYPWTNATQLLSA